MSTQDFPFVRDDDGDLYVQETYREESDESRGLGLATATFIALFWLLLGFAIACVRSHQ